MRAALSRHLHGNAHGFRALVCALAVVFVTTLLSALAWLDAGLAWRGFQPLPPERAQPPLCLAGPEEGEQGSSSGGEEEEEEEDSEDPVAQDNKRLRSEVGRHKVRGQPCGAAGSASAEVCPLGRSHPR